MKKLLSCLLMVCMFMYVGTYVNASLSSGTKVTIFENSMDIDWNFPTSYEGENLVITLPSGMEEHFSINKSTQSGVKGTLVTTEGNYSTHPTMKHILINNSNLDTPSFYSLFQDSNTAWGYTMTYCYVEGSEPKFGSQLKSDDGKLYTIVEFKSTGISVADTHISINVEQGKMYKIELCVFKDTTVVKINGDTVLNKRTNLNDLTGISEIRPVQQFLAHYPQLTDSIRQSVFYSDMSLYYIEDGDYYVQNYSDNNIKLKGIVNATSEKTVITGTYTNGYLTGVSVDSLDTSERFIENNYSLSGHKQGYDTVKQFVLDSCEELSPTKKVFCEDIFSLT